MLDPKKIAERTQVLKKALQQRILVIDGAMGTALDARNLSVEDYGGPEYEGCPEMLNITRPDVVRSIHEQYLQAGADIIETNSFGGTSLVLAEYGLQDRTEEISERAATLADEVATEFSTAEKPRFVAGSMGPTTKAISLTGGVTFGELVDTYQEQAAALINGGVDYLLVETAQDTRNVKAALVGAERAFEDLGVEVPVAVSITVEPSGTMLAGQPVDALLTSLEQKDLLYIGLNCATGPELMTDHIRTLAENAPMAVACVPNAGLPNEDGVYTESPDELAKVLHSFAAQGWLNVVGGCCGTNHHHIQALAQAVAGEKPHQPAQLKGARISGLENLEITEENRPIIVGERTNVIGSRLFRNMIEQEKWDEATEVARRQVRNGAQVIDICLANPDRDELADMETFLENVANRVKVPLMIDSTDPAVIEKALTYSQGKAVINSVNLEDGGERMAAVAKLARRFGAALVVGTIDESGMALTRDRKLAVAQRAYSILVDEYGLAPADLVFDPLTFPCATGDKQYEGAAEETVAGLRLIKEAFPESKTILGISNVSFGLPPVGREVINSVFLYHCTQAGLDMAIVNSEKLRRYATIPDDEKQLAEGVLFKTSEESINRFVQRYRESKAAAPQLKRAELSLDERLSTCVVQGSKEGLIDDLELALAGRAPLEIINGPLMSGMAEVGRLFNQNELIVAEVLQSAEVMKAAVDYLEPHMDKEDTVARGTVLLATVKGDVHDIGKNLVDIILSNNGFRVINLGTKVEPTVLVQAVQKHQPDIVGLSGLLVRSTHQMVTAAEALAQAGVCPPLLLGGAALTREFVRRRVAPVYPGIVAYSADAMKGLALANQIVDPEKRRGLAEELQATRERVAAKKEVHSEARSGSTERSEQISILETVPAAPDLERHLIHDIPLDEVWDHLNLPMLFNKHLGLHGNYKALLAAGDDKAVLLTKLIDELKELGRQGSMRVHGMYQYFTAFSSENNITLADQTGTPVAKLSFPRQVKGDRLCLADYVSPEAEKKDSLALFVVSAGQGISALAQEFKLHGDLLKSHAIAALALATAEAAAEWVHARVREQWGVGKRGERYSFGYAACPDLRQQQVLFDLLHPEEIGVELTTEFMMDPEASVSGLILHHPSCRYFSTGAH